MKKPLDLAIVGAGPAGLFAGYQLARSSRSLKLAFLVNTPKPTDVFWRNKSKHHNPVGVEGLGGSGLFSDKLYFDAAGEWLELRDQEYSQIIMAYAAEIFERYVGVSERGAVAPKSMPQPPGLLYKPHPMLVPITASNYLRFVRSLVEKLDGFGVKFIYDASVQDVKKLSSSFKLVLNRKRMVSARNVLFASGRSSAAWFERIGSRLRLKLRKGRPYFGIRLETRADWIRSLREYGNDPKFELPSNVSTSYTKTHCVCFNGHVLSCKCGEMILVDGTKLSTPSENTSLNILTRIPRTLSSNRCKEIISHILQEGGGRPLVQRMEDFRIGSPTFGRALKTNKVKRTLKESSPGEITHLLPPQMQDNLVDFLDTMRISYPKLAHPDNLIYAPVFEWFQPRVWIGPSGQTSIPGVFVAGDIAGVSQGVVPAATHGLQIGSKLANLL